MSVFKAPSLWPGFFSYPTGTRNYRLKKGWYMSSSQSSYVTKFLDKPHEYLTGLPRSPALYSPMLLFYVLREALLERHLLFNALSSSKTTQKNNDWVREHACQGERRNRTYLKNMFVENTKLRVREAPLEIGKKCDSSLFCALISVIPGL